MPWNLAKSDGGFKVQNKSSGKTYSKQPLSKKRATAQLRAIYANAKESIADRIDVAIEAAQAFRVVSMAGSRHLVLEGAYAKHGLSQLTVEARGRALQLGVAALDKAVWHPSFVSWKMGDQLVQSTTPNTAFAAKLAAAMDGIA